MAHDGLIKRTIVADGRLLEVVTTVDQGPGRGEIPGGER
jgi:hypothetical protein